MEVYAAEVELMDAGIGRVVGALREIGQLDQTLVLFLSDNGGCAEKIGREPATRPARPESTRDGRTIRDGPATMPGPDDTFITYGRNWANVSNTPFRMYKHWVHEGGIATPLIAHWPATISRRGALEHQPGHVIDLMPTCIALSGAKDPVQINGDRAAPLPGVNLLPALEGKSTQRKDAIFWEHEGNRAMRLGQWKLVARGSDGQWELYDIAADRTELNDLAASNPDRVKDMAAQWDRWARSSNVFPLNPFDIRQ
jgi:arylsulfatase